MKISELIEAKKPVGSSALVQLAKLPQPIGINGGSYTYWVDVTKKPLKFTASDGEVADAKTLRDISHWLDKHVVQDWEDFIDGNGESVQWLIDNGIIKLKKGRNDQRDHEARMNEGDVIKGSFGKKTGRAETSIDVPPGFDRFKQDGKKIIGIKDNKEHLVSTTTDEVLARALVRAYNNDGKTDDDIKPLSWTKAFGSAELGALEDAGVKITEKPGYWDDFEEGGYAAKKNITQIVMKKVEKALGKKLKVYTGDELFDEDNKGSDKPKGPLVSPKVMPKEAMFIVHFNDGTKYLCDLTGANTYIRNWQKIA